jgi:hypothetical protein
VSCTKSLRVRVGQGAKRLIGYFPAPIGLYLLISLRWLLKRSARIRDRRVRRIFRELGSPARVMSGPFAGMHYLGPALASQGGYLPKLLGCYESECTAAVERLIARQPDCLVNVGAAEGYYAVGFMTRLPGLRVEAFEAERPYHAAISALALRNGIDSGITIRGVCTPGALESALASAARPILVMDCEGAEREILNVHDVPHLRTTCILVELHERLRPGVTRDIVERFSPTHRIVRMGTRPHDMPAGAADRTLSREDRDFALDEGRGPEMEWLLLECP